MLFGRRTLLTLGLAGALGTPLLLSEDNGIVESIGESISSFSGSFTGGSRSEVDPAKILADASGPSGTGLPNAGSTIGGGGSYTAAGPPADGSLADGPPIDGPAVRRVGEVLRFDVTPDWVTRRWSRVTMIPTGNHLQGYRVPLVTGTATPDLAGSLTYYFDALKRPQRVRFVGSTGDPAPLIALVSSRFGFVAVRSREPDVELYQILWNGSPTSEMRIRIANVVRSDVPNRKYDVELEINTPDGQLSRKEREAKTQG